MDKAIKVTYYKAQLLIQQLIHPLLHDMAGRGAIIMHPQPVYMPVKQCLYGAVAAVHQKLLYHIL